MQQVTKDVLIPSMEEEPLPLEQEDDWIEEEHELNDINEGEEEEESN
jgi:hypothetical protein